MRVVIVGAGLAGLSAAHYLLERGGRVEIIEALGGPGFGTSYANGALLHPSLTEPWNSPGVLGFVLRSLGRADSPMLLRPGALPSLLSWGWRFVRESRPARYRANARANLRLALESMREMAAIRDTLRIDYGRTVRGSLQIFRSQPDFDIALSWSAEQAGDGRVHRELSVADVIALEPALDAVRESLVGGIHYPVDEGGDAHRFCVGLAASLVSRGARLHFDRTVDALVVRQGRVAGVVAGGEALDADVVVLAAASRSRELAQTAGIDLPVRPVKGYSITVPASAFADGPRPAVPVVDASLHVAIVPLAGGGLRIAGTAEFAGHDTALDPRRVASLVAVARRVYPQPLARAATLDVAPWTGLRPMSPDGVPLVGPTRLDGLFLNTGHGHLGWTLAAGSGRLLADLLHGRPTRVDATAYSPRRFS